MRWKQSQLEEDPLVQETPSCHVEPIAPHASREGRHADTHVTLKDPGVRPFDLV